MYAPWRWWRFETCKKYVHVSVCVIKSFFNVLLGPIHTRRSNPHGTNFDVLLTVHLRIIVVNNQLNAHNLVL